MDVIERRNYELGYHIDPKVPETEIPSIRQEIEQIITSQEGIISYSKEPEKAHLSYPVKHERSSYFAYIQFSLPARQRPEPQALAGGPNGDGLAHIEEQLRPNTRLLRHVILKLESDAERQKAAAKAKISQERIQERAKRAPAAPITPQESEHIEQKIEEIIGNL